MNEYKAHELSNIITAMNGVDFYLSFFQKL